MCDRDHRALFHQPGELLLDRRLDLGIERRGRLVEHQDRRVLQNHAGEGDALALAARQFDAALADMRVEPGPAVPILQPLDEFEGMRAPRRVDDRLLGGIRMAIPNVVADRAVQQRGVLRDHADLRPQAFLGQPGDVLPVDQDAAALWPIEAEQQMHEGRFAGAGAAD